MWTAVLQPPLTAAARRPAPRCAGPQNPRAAPSPAASVPESSLPPSLSPAASPGPAHLRSRPRPPQARRCPAGLRASRKETLLFFWGRLLFACGLLSGDFCSFPRSVPGAHGNLRSRCVQALFFSSRSAFFVTLRRGCSGYFCNFPPPPAGGPGVARGRGPGDATWTARGCRPHRRRASPPVALDPAPRRQPVGWRSVRGSR